MAGNGDNTKETQGGGILAQRLKALAEEPEDHPIDKQRIQTLQRRRAAPRKLEAGQVLSGHYRIVEKLGAGGMGMVFKVEDMTLDNRPFAIKVLPPELSRDDGAVNRLKKEALAAMELHHSHIMTVNAFEGLSEVKFLVMEYLDGPNLDIALSEKERFTVEEVIEIGEQVCSALDFAHSRNVIHRDIKPANLVYKMEAGKQVVKIADFGIAYQIRESQAKITGEVSAAGTLFYMAPEQFLGKRPTAMSDQYSLAVSFYEMLSGHPPITGTTIEMIIELVKTLKPEPIEGLPEHVNAALLRAMDKNPDQRFESCMAFCRALDGEAQPAAPTVHIKAKQTEGINAASAARQAELRQFLNSNLFDDDEDEAAAEEEEARRLAAERKAAEAEARRRVAEAEERRKAAEAARQVQLQKAQQSATLAPVVIPEEPVHTGQLPLSPTPIPSASAVPVAPALKPIAPTTPPPPKHRRPRMSAPQAFQQTVPVENPVELKGDYNEERLAEIDNMVVNARTALRDTIIMGIGFIVLVVVLVMIVF